MYAVVNKESARFSLTAVKLSPLIDFSYTYLNSENFPHLPSDTLDSFIRENNNYVLNVNRYPKIPEVQKIKDIDECIHDKS